MSLRPLSIFKWPLKTGFTVLVLCKFYISITGKCLPKNYFSYFSTKPYLTRHAKRYELGGRRHFEKIRLKVNVASRKNSTPKRVSKRSLTYYKTGSKAFFMLRFSATRLSNILYDIKCYLLNVPKLKMGRESSTQFSL